MLLLLLTGCDRLMLAAELIDGYGDTTVVQGLFLGADVPGGIDLPEESGIYTAACKVFMAEVADPTQFDEAPLEGARLRFESEETGKLSFLEDNEEPGKYFVTSLTGLDYQPGQEAVIQFEAGGESGELRIRAPAAPEAEVPNAHFARSALRVTLVDSEFTNIVAAVYDLDHGKLTWDNLPEDVNAAYELNEDGVDEPITTMLLPAEAFPRSGRYVVAVGGLALADPDEFSGANTALSNFAAAQMSMHLVFVSPPNG